MFKCTLVANRGEIALRVIRACRDLGIEVVAVFSEADRDAPYLKLADQAICIGPAVATESYLNIPRIISVAEIAAADAIHPGFGFLSENAYFAEVVRSCNMEFIRPSADAMRQLGYKSEARKVAQEANVPVVPGSDGLFTSEAEAVSLAREMGYPVLIKAAAGGGGKGMRLAHDEAGLKTGLVAAKQEAEKAFKDGGVYLEKYIERPRHVEVQLLGDKHGNVVHLWERDCSLQRRHQKLVDRDERHLEVRYYDVPHKYRVWILPREDAQDLVRWWVEQGANHATQSRKLPEQKFGRIFVSILSHSQVYCRGSNPLGSPKVTGYQFPRAVVETLALHLRPVRDRLLQVETKTIGDTP